MAKISARGATPVRKVKRTVTFSDGTSATAHQVLCSDGRILERVAFRSPGDRARSGAYTLKARTTAVPDSWLVAKIANGWERE